MKYFKLLLNTEIMIKDWWKFWCNIREM